MTGGAKELFQVIVGARQIGHLVAHEQPLTIASGDFLEVCNRRGQGTELLLLLRHGGQELLIVPFEGVYITLFGVGEQVGCLMHPRIGLAESREEIFSRCQSCSYYLLEAAEFGGKPLFCSTRAIESEIS